MDNVKQLNEEIHFTSSEEYQKETENVLKCIKAGESYESRLFSEKDIDLLKNFINKDPKFTFEDVLDGFKLHVSNNYNKYKEKRDILVAYVKERNAHPTYYIGHINDFINEYFADGELLNMLGVFYDDIGERGRALEYYYEALKSKNPPSGKIYNNLYRHFYGEALKKLQDRKPYNSIFDSIYKTIKYHNLMVANKKEGEIDDETKSKNKRIMGNMKKSLFQVIRSKNLYSFVTNKYDEETAASYFIPKNKENVHTDFLEVLKKSEEEYNQVLDELEAVVNQ